MTLVHAPAPLSIGNISSSSSNLKVSVIEDTVMRSLVSLIRTVAVIGRGFSRSFLSPRSTAWSVPLPAVQDD